MDWQKVIGICLIVLYLLYFIYQAVNFYVWKKKYDKRLVEQLAEIRARQQQEEQEEEQEDPCDACLRWPECNGVDQDSCPKF